MSEVKEKYIQFCCDFYNEHAPENKLWFGRMFEQCQEDYEQQNRCMYRWQFPLIILKGQQAEIDQLKADLALCREENKGLIEKLSWMQGQILELEAKHKTKNERIIKLVSIFTSLSSQILCEEPELSDEFYKKFDEFHSVLINIEL